MLLQKGFDEVRWNRVCAVRGSRLGVRRGRRRKAGLRAVKRFYYRRRPGRPRGGLSLRGLLPAMRQKVSGTGLAASAGAPAAAAAAASTASTAAATSSSSAAALVAAVAAEDLAAATVAAADAFARAAVMVRESSWSGAVALVRTGR